ncbi:hypothetical protein [Archaeoglobus sp.]
MKDEIPEGFIEAVNFVIENASVIIETLNKLARDYMIGKDIRKSLKSFKERFELPFMLIYDILTKNETTMNWLNKIVEEDNKWLFSKIEEFSILRDEFEAVRLEDYGYVNSITRIFGVPDYNENLMIPFIEIKLFSFGKEVLQFKEDIDYIAWLISDLTGRLLNCLEEYKNKPIRKESLLYLRERMKEIINNSEKVLKILNEMGGEES